jgi:hypothetical protein
MQNTRLSRLEISDHKLAVTRGRTGKITYITPLIPAPCFSDEAKDDATVFLQDSNISMDTCDQPFKKGSIENRFAGGKLASDQVYFRVCFASLYTA